MIERLHELLDRPIAAGQRRRLFALAAALLLCAAIGLVLVGRPAPERGRASTAPTHTTNTQPAPAPPAPQPPPPSEPGRAEAAARRFLAGYLAYLYGHGPARAIKGVGPRLRRRLEARRPRVSPATRRRRGRVVDLSARLLGGGRIAVTATIDDGGVARYPIALTVAQRAGGLEVVEVGGE